MASRAVTWQMDSSPFTFPSLAIKDNNAGLGHADLNLRIGKSSHDGSVEFNFRVPVGSGTSTLCIYSLNGVQIQDYNLSHTLTSVRWDCDKDQVTAGVYIASLKCGVAEKKLRFSIIQ